ncbi:hypothetical protein OSTOST_14986 [Ostertagia ostertagi]
MVAERVIHENKIDKAIAGQAEVALHGSLPLTESTSSVTIFGRLAADQKLPFRWRELYHIFEPNRRDIEHYTPQEITRRITQQPFNVRIDR